ncbi:DUF1851 domain-containing protein [Bacillaceae bacterium Marseille-Q3522]|nr:DUF1851 domain-containing protein [Bacillaceae bacterium Marseille-Q3522]
MGFEKFLKTFPPESDCIHLGKAITEKYKKIAPQVLLDFWQNQGTGKYGNGIIELINPEEYRSTLETWLGKEVPNYVPLALSAFGHFFYFRKLTEKEEDVCVIDPHYRLTHVCSLRMETFFNDYLTDEGLKNHELMKQLFNKAIDKLGSLERGEIFYFEPALCFGGAEHLKYINKGNAKVHLELLFQMGL